MHKNQDINFAPEKQRKWKKRTRKSPKKAKPGAFWVLEGMGTVENRGERMGKASNRAEKLVSPAGSVGPGRSPPGCRPPRHAPQAGLRAHLVAKSYRTLTKKSGTAEAIPDFFGRGRRTCLGCRLGRLVACVPLARTRPATRAAGGPAGAPRCQILPLTNEKSQVPQKRYLTFLAGAEGLEPSARGFGVDVGERTKKRGRAGVDQFLPQVRKGAVLVWCWEEIIRAKTGEKERKIPAKAGNTLT